MPEDTNEQKRILLGLHELGGRAMMKSISEDYGYVVDAPISPEEIISLARENDYDICYMDINFGKPNSDDITPSARVFEILRDRVDKGLTRFLAISCNSNALLAAKRQGIPVEDKYDVNIEGIFE
jgi:hypothetical protein